VTAALPGNPATLPNCSKPCRPTRPDHHHVDGHDHHHVGDHRRHRHRRSTIITSTSTASTILTLTITPSNLDGS
jgi:hypothetical protein